ncbi:Gamma-aminobutyric acid receptor subunit alpha-4-like [Homarus americanus]|uniref:Gamma-aminobutyric acid receptor subunit alpha-4-like n=1 Tax=Homarus americanus TaxID=6706 RepID=A0A8J5J6V1_HOMAM|nr:Gamma-aminobutyric acid receptor subunit alpha-4-like [Homarus americanus]
MGVVMVVMVVVVAAAEPISWTGNTKRGLSFQSENLPTDDSYASLYLTSNMTSTADLSMCVWVKVLHFKESSSYLLSYATSDLNNNEMNLAIKPSQLMIAIGGTYLHQKKTPLTYLPDVWYHICFVTSQQDSRGTFYLNGKKSTSFKLPKRDILLNGSLTLGQEADKVNGGYQAQQSFSGIITGFNMYSRQLRGEEVEALAGCEVEEVEGDLVGWRTAVWSVNGDVTQVDLSVEEYCTPERGFTKYYISFDGNHTWSLINMWSSEAVATYFTYESDLPLGRRDWRTTADFQLCDKPAGEKHLLSLSACYDHEYTCDEGTCINLTQRCDLRVDCPDNTDETGCDKLSRPPEYLHSLPPPGVELGPLSLNTSVTLKGFSQVDIRDMKLTVDFSIIITWFDLRLRYKNLKDLSDLNFIQPSLVWTPSLELVNADFPNTYKTAAVLTVVRQSPPEEDDPRLPAHDELYEGSKNPLRLNQKFNAPFSCTMDLRNFPFDNQHCSLLLRLTSARSDFLRWHKMTVDYPGEVLLTEYEVGKFSIDRQTIDEYSVARVKINFSRRYGYYLLSAYLPTVMLMIISYASLYCKRESRDLRVMMALTTLLVLYALYQQTL